MSEEQAALETGITKHRKVHERIEKLKKGHVHGRGGSESLISSLASICDSLDENGLIDCVAGGSAMTTKALKMVKKTSGSVRVMPPEIGEMVSCGALEDPDVSRSSLMRVRLARSGDFLDAGIESSRPKAWVFSPRLGSGHGRKLM